MWKAAPRVIVSTITLTKRRLSPSALVSVEHLFRREGIFGLSGVATVKSGAMSNSNGGLYAALVGYSGNERARRRYLYFVS